MHLNMIKIFVSFVFFLSSFACHSEDWNPEVRFTLENADYMQTLSWVSGVSYALTNYQASTSTPVFCGTPNSIGSKVLLGYLNAAHSGSKITAEQAIATIFKSLKRDYPCT